MTTIGTDDAPRTRIRPERDPNAWKWWLGSIGVVVLFLAAWEALPRLGLVHEIILPPISDVSVALVEVVSDPNFFRHARVTLSEILFGFLLGTIVGLVLGIMLGIWDSMRKLFYPLVVAFQSLPKIVLAPLLLTWFGYGMMSKIMLAVLIAFFPVLINTMVGLQSVPNEAVQLMRSLRASQLQTFWKLSLPHASPLIFAGVKTGLTFAIIGAIVGEFVGSSVGLGYLLHAYNFQLRIDRVFALIVLLSVVGALAFFLVDWLDRKLIFWRSTTVV